MGLHLEDHSWGRHWRLLSCVAYLLAVCVLLRLDHCVRQIKLGRSKAAVEPSKRLVDLGRHASAPAASVTRERRCSRWSSTMSLMAFFDCSVCQAAWRRSLAMRAGETPQPHAHSTTYDDAGLIEFDEPTEFRTDTG